jgi:hypothetical protein
MNTATAGLRFRLAGIPGWPAFKALTRYVRSVHACML